MSTFDIVFWKLYLAIGFILPMALLWRTINECYRDKSWKTGLKEELLIHPSHYIAMFFFWWIFPYTLMIFMNPEPAISRKRYSKLNRWAKRCKQENDEFDPDIYITKSPDNVVKKLYDGFEESAMKRVEVFDKTVETVEKQSKAAALISLILAFLSGGAAKSHAQSKKKDEEEKLKVSIAELVQVVAKNKPLELGYSRAALSFPKKWLLEFQMFNEPGSDTFEFLFGKTVVDKKFFKLAPMPLISVNDSGEVWCGINLRMIFEVKKLKFTFPFVRHIFPVNGDVEKTFIVCIADYPVSKSFRVGMGNINYKESGNRFVIRIGPSFSLSRGKWDFFLFTYINLRDEIPGLQFQVSRNF